MYFQVMSDSPDLDFVYGDSDRYENEMSGRYIVNNFGHLLIAISLMSDDVH